MTEIGINVEKASDLLRSGHLVAIPTETVYGLAGNALKNETLLQIFSVKNRPTFDPLICHIFSMRHLDSLVEQPSSLVEKLMHHFWPGPLTILFKKKEIIPDLATSGLETVAIRMPRHPLTRQLLGQLDFPLAAPSANPFGYISPTTAQHVADQLWDKIPYILDGGPCLLGLESTIISIINEEIHIHRLGAVTEEDLALFATTRLYINLSSNPQAPGQLKSHYAPRIPLFLYDEGKMPDHVPANTGLLFFQTSNREGDVVEVLSSQGSMQEAAQNLFAALRRFDKTTCTQLWAERVPAIGLGKAINDRLLRASKR